MAEVVTEYKCPKCSHICLSFMTLCHHVQYDHELWYLGKSHRALPLSSFPNSLIVVPTTENHQIISDARTLTQAHETSVKLPSNSLSQNAIQHALVKQLEEQERDLYETKAKLHLEVLEKCSFQRSMKELAQKYDCLHEEVNRLQQELEGKNKTVTHDISSVQEMPLKNPENQTEISLLHVGSRKLPSSYSSTPVSFLKPLNVRNISGSVPSITRFHKVHSDSCISCTSGISNKCVNKTKFDYIYPPSHDKIAGCSTVEQQHSIPDNYSIITTTCSSNIGISPYKSTPAHHDHTVCGHTSHSGSVISQSASTVAALHKIPIHLSKCSKISASQVSQTDSGKGESVITRPNDNVKNGDSQETQHLFLKLVFYYLDTNTLLICRKVCHIWKHVAEQPQYWITVNLASLAVTPKLLQTMSQWCTNTQSLTLQAVKISRKQSNKSLLQVLQSTRGVLESGLEALLRSTQYTLTALSIVSCGNLFTERCLWLVSCYCHYLTRFAYFSQYSPATPEAIWSLGAGCRKLHTLIIPPLYPSLQPERFSNRCLLMIAKCWSHLRVLCIGGTEVEVSGLVAVVHRCRKLEILELDHMGEIQEPASVAICREGLQRLQRFYFTHTPVNPSAIKHIYTSCHSLKVIGIILSPEDYFVHPDYGPNKEEYQQKIRHLSDLLEHPGLKDILHLKFSES